jgi:hypothetical protein
MKNAFSKSIISLFIMLFSTTSLAQQTSITHLLTCEGMMDGKNVVLITQSWYDLDHDKNRQDRLTWFSRMINQKYPNFAFMPNEKIEDCIFHHFDGAGSVPMAARGALFRKVRTEGKTPINEAWNGYEIRKH